MATAPVYPVRVDGELQDGLSRWLWLVKWILVIPHVIVLAVLWIAFSVLTLVAFVAVLFTGRYPRKIYGFNVGVLRWSWRGAFYTIGAFGTDRYPPFTLGDAPEYPARLTVAYPEHLPRGFRLIGRWLLGIPHYIVAAAFAGGGWFAFEQSTTRFSSPGLVGMLALIAALVLLFTGRYPRSLFDFLLGLDRWVLRTAAYASFLTDEYPPFRLDPGEHELDLAVTTPLSEGPAGVATEAGPRFRHWLSIVLGSLGVLVALGLVAAGGVAVWADRSQRDAGGYVTTPARQLATGDYALASKSIDIHWHGPSWLYPSRLIGSAQIRAASTTPGRPIFIGIARSRDVERYLQGVAHAQVRDVSVSPFHVRYARSAGGAPRVVPGRSPIWVASTSGTGPQHLNWNVRSGRFAVVVMNADGSRGVAADISVGATFPELGWIAFSLLIMGALSLALAVILLVYGASGWHRRTP
jgi:hypothetical protein